jgi:anti-sigma-K factor RskA
MSMSEPTRAGGQHVEVAVYLLGKLEGGEAERFEAHLEGCADCRRHLEELGGLPALLAQAAPATALPDGLRARTLTAVRDRAAGDERDAVDKAAAIGESGTAENTAVGAPPVPLRRPWWRQRWVLAAVAAALVVALAVPGALLVFGGGGGDVTRLTLVAAEGATGHGQVTVTRTPAGRSFDVRIEGMEPPAAGSLYELWAVNLQDTLDRPKRVSLGTFTVGPGGAAHLKAFTAAPADQYPVVGVTLEPVDGNPARTGPRVLVPGPPG